jgi:hypothetical protein
VRINANQAKLALQFPKAMDAILREYDVASANALDKCHTAEPRFVHKFVNCVHVVFDRRFHCNAEVFLTKKAVDEALR